MRLTIGTFTPSVLLAVARDTGRLERAGLEVEERAVTSSPAQFRELADGGFDAVLTNPDNAIAYRFLDSNPLGERLPVVITAGIDRGLGVALFLRPGITELPTGTRAVLGVDVPSSGYAFVAYAVLEASGALRDRDYDVVTLGSTPKRAEALRAGECDATIVNAGNDVRVADAGCFALGRASDLGPYLGTVLCRLEGSQESAAADALGDVLIDTAGEIRAGGRTGELTVAAERLLGLSPPQAAAHARVAESEAEGFVADGRTDRASLDTLLRLRRRYLPDAATDQVGARFGDLVVGRAA